MQRQWPVHLYIKGKMLAGSRGKGEKLNETCNNFTIPSTCMYLNHFEVVGEHLTEPVPHPLISLFFCGYNDEHIQLLISVGVMT